MNEQTIHQANTDGLLIKCKKDFDANKFDVSIHLYRESDSTLFSIFRSNERRMQDPYIFAHPLISKGEIVTSKTKFDFERTFGIISFMEPKPWSNSREMLPLKRSGVAAEILQRIDDPVFFGVHLRPSVIDSGHVAIGALEIVALSAAEESGGYQTFRSEKEEKKNGVSLLHILSEVDDSCSDD